MSLSDDTKGNNPFENGILLNFSTKSSADCIVIPGLVKWGKGVDT